MQDILKLGVVAGMAMIVSFAAEAADLRRPAYRAPADCATCNWNGFYVGANVGESRGASSTQESWTWFTNYPVGALVGTGGGPLRALTTPTTFTTTFNNQYRHASAGLIGGLQGGYNWQVGALLIGVEGDWSWSSGKDSVTYSAQPIAAQFPPLPNFFFVPGTTQGWTSEEKIDWLTTLRARLGWAHNDYLWYATAGVAWAKIESNYALFSSPGNSGLSAAAGGFGPGTFAQWGLPGGAAAANFSTIKTGWALGGGVETAIGALFGLGRDTRWTAKLEYLYVDLGNVTNAFGTNLVPVCASTCATPATGSTSFLSSSHVREQIIRIGVNYRLGTAVAAISK